MAKPSYRARSPAATLALCVSVAVLVALWRCPVAELLGVPCPGCGLGRATLALATGNLGVALRLHPLAPIVVLIGAALAARELLATGGSRARQSALGSASEGLAGVLLGMLLCVWIARFFGAFGGPVPVTSHLLGWPRQSRPAREARVPTFEPAGAMRLGFKRIGTRPFHDERGLR